MPGTAGKSIEAEFGKTGEPVVQTASDQDALAENAAHLFVRIAREAILARGRFTVALSGGSTPEKMHRKLAQIPFVEQIDWSRVLLFLGDERFVSPDDERSNYGMAKRTLIDHIPIPATNIFPVDTSLPTADDAARAYALTLSTHLSPAPDAPPVFDLILLGLGDDGHTASLFPGMPSLDITDRWAVASPPGVLPPPVERVTTTFPVLNAARNVAFLIAGVKKAEVVRALLKDSPDIPKRPASGVHPESGALTYLLDTEAAKLL